MVPFYGKLGYVAHGDEFDEEGGELRNDEAQLTAEPHLLMEREIVAVA